MMKIFSWTTCFFLCASLQLSAQNINPSIRINQAGYYPLAPKAAIVLSPTEKGAFFITAPNASDTLFTGNLVEISSTKNASLITSLADFSNFHTPGTYVLHIVGHPDSYPFDIKENVLKPAAVAALKGFYFQRASTRLMEKYAGKWARPSGHPDNKVMIHSSAETGQRLAGSSISTPGGWYDGMDYNKYMVNAGITMGTLLSAYEDFPIYFKNINTNIPESNDAVPDILNEIIYNLRWMFTMQDPNDGGVYNKCTNATTEEMQMPEKAVAQRYVVQKGTAATLDFIAVMAQASRILAAFQKQLPGLHDSCMNAAKFAWDWVLKNPAIEYNQSAMNKMMFKPAVSTTAYGDKAFYDEWFWAATELYISTGNEDYFSYIAKNVNSKMSLPSWNNVFALAFYSLNRNEKKLQPKHPKELETIKRSIKEYADNYLSAINDNPFKTVMGQAAGDFALGSNAIAANQGILLVNAYLVSKDRKYADAALTNMDYILGRNATGYSFITGIGSKPPMHPYHPVSIADGIEEPVPGLLVGGPNSDRQDKCSGYPSMLPANSYLDSNCSYSTNAVAINWNAALVYLAHAIEALQYELAYSNPKKAK